MACHGLHVRSLYISHGLPHGYQGTRPCSPDHREAAQPMGAAVAGVEVLCEHQTVPTCALTTTSTAAVEVMWGERLILSATTQERGSGSSRLYGLKVHP